MNRETQQSTELGDPDFQISQEQLTLFRNFISTKKILIADISQSIRSSISKALSEMGAKSNQIFLASTYDDAVEQIRAQRPAVLITDYNLERHFGLELIPALREACPEAENRVFILVTGNAAESVVAEAAEEDVDSYILKPFSNLSIRYYLVRACLNKSNPNAYRMELARGKQLFDSNQFEDALISFTSALKMDPSPTLACFYLGQSYDKLLKPADSEKSYKNGLTFNEIHYKCSVALFDFYAARGRSAEAYTVMRKIAQHFPITPQRLGKAMELAIRTQNFDDITQYYEIFISIDERRDDLRKCVCAALIVGGMFKLRHGQNDVALDLLQKAAITSAANPAVLREIVLMLVKFNLPDPAVAFLKRFPPHSHKEPDFLCADFAVLNHTGRIEDIIVSGRKLLGKGVQDPLLHSIMIRREAEFGHADAAETLMTEAVSVWPNETETFQNILKNSTPAS